MLVSVLVTRVARPMPSSGQMVNYNQTLLTFKANPRDCYAAKNILRTILRKLFVAQGFQKIFQAINCWMQQATKLKRISVYQVLEKT